jgi:hypothetical protein
VLARFAMVLFLIGFAIWWNIVLWGVSRVSGWAAVAERYPALKPFEGKWILWRSMYIGWWIGGYRYAVIVGVAPEGLYLSVVILFRAGHSPIFIPWDDIATTRIERFWLDMIEVKLARVPDRPLYFREVTWQLVLEKRA